MISHVAMVNHMIVQVSALSHKGKNRIAEHGIDWLMLKKHEDGSVLIQSLKNSDYVRWVEINDLHLSFQGTS